MALSDEDALLAGQLRRMQIILAALLAGALIWGVVAFAIRQGGGFGPPAAQTIVSYIVFALAVVELIPFVFYTAAVVKTTRRRIAKNEWPPGQPQQLTMSYQEQLTMRVIYIPSVLRAAYNMSDRARLLMLYSYRLIVGASILEGATCALIIGFIMDATRWTLIAALVFVVLNALQFPTRTRVERWLDEQQELLQKDRMGV